MAIFSTVGVLKSLYILIEFMKAFRRLRRITPCLQFQRPDNFSGGTLRRKRFHKWSMRRDVACNVSTLIFFSAAVGVPKSLLHIFDFKFTPSANFLVTNNNASEMYALIHLLKLFLLYFMNKIILETVMNINLTKYKIKKSLNVN